LIAHRSATYARGNRSMKRRRRETYKSPRRWWQIWRKKDG